ncbi:MAG: hypothetical protein R3B46_02630 [Phycisphaerales bacterium]
MEERNFKPHDATRGGRCVLIAPSAPPAELMDALNRKQLDIREHHSIISAMGEVMAHARLVKSGAIREPLVLLIVDRARVPRADELVAACAMYAPHAVAWTYDQSAKPALRSYQSAVSNTPRPEPVPTPAATPARQSPKIVISHTPPPSPQITVVRRKGGGGEPNLRLTGSGPAPSPATEPKPAPRDESPQTQPPTEPPALTDDELRMLLSDDWNPSQGKERDNK